MFDRSVMSFGLDGVNHQMFGLIGATRVCSSFRRGVCGGFAERGREKAEGLLTISVGGHDQHGD